MTKRQVNVHAAKTHLSRLLEEVEAGEEIVLARSGRPVARLIPFKPRREPRVPGAWRGRIRMAPDFDATPDELTASFGA
jgi:prevent-host-death family protein